MKKETPQPTYLKDYRSPAYLTDSIDLTFELAGETTRVRSVQKIRLNPDRKGVVEPLILHGRELQLDQLVLDGRLLHESEFSLDEEQLRIDSVPREFTLEVVTFTAPANNTSLEGLYLSSGNFCTQCEAQGFRKITYYADRPDVMARFTTRIIADKAVCPVLLSNGNLLEQGDLDGGRHYALWEDPFPKPSYLFALVAGDLVCIEDHYRTMSGRYVLLQIYVEERNKDYCAHAMQSLHKSMAWDEQVFGLEYDLDRYMIVAVDDFNMGAMENKGLNIFNSKYVLAHPDTATDADFLAVEEVIGHEYFHNWTGNRVTCRDWFQLSLKEGLTVFRDQQFSADMNSAAVKRIDDVRVLRQSQFPEDAGPMAHPVRPASYVEINNFYTVTVYNKGGEVIRMLQALLGREKFIEGVQLYLRRHDGQAATTDDFVAAMEDAAGKDLQQFRRWYDQAGTPRVTLASQYDAGKKTLTLELSQQCPATPGQTEKLPFHIPIAVGLIDREGRDIPLRLEGEGPAGDTTRVLELTQSRQSFCLTGVDAKPVVSALRNFSAPVKLDADSSADELAFRLAHDSDPFNRWEAGQLLAQQELLQRIKEGHQSANLFSAWFVDSWRKALADREADRSLLSQLLSLPGELYLAELVEEIDPDAIRQVRDLGRRQLARDARDLLLERYHECSTAQAYSLEPEGVGRRSLRNFCLGCLMLLEEPEINQLCLDQYRQADNMTDRLAAFAALVDSDLAERQTVLDDFYRRWQSHPLVLDKWFMLQALSHRKTVVAEVESLLQHPAFTLQNPNRTRSLLGAFSAGNLAGFHRQDGRGYQLLVEQILLLDAKNPQVAARMAGPLSRWKRLEPGRRALMKRQLERLQGEKLSRDLYEIVSKSLQ
ncbi:MAG: aminopeptidase N [Desulfuromonadales bacterium]|nr:aminopeptidase N [Desulfuromonadales bacterium]